MLDYPAHSAEPNRAWQHMANAGLVEGAYSGLNSTIYGTTPGGNVPRSKLNNLVIGFGWWPSSNTSGIYTGSATHFDGYYGNVFPLQGGRNNSLSPPQNRILRPEEMWNVDAKLDDGIPHMGKFRARKGFGCTLNDATAPEYALSVKDIVCNGSYNL